ASLGLAIPALTRGASPPVEPCPGAPPSASPCLRGAAARGGARERAGVSSARGAAGERDGVQGARERGGTGGGGGSTAARKEREAARRGRAAGERSGVQSARGASGVAAWWQGASRGKKEMKELDEGELMAERNALFAMLARHIGLTGGPVPSLMCLDASERGIK
ncbi:hypothetical protein BRADI_2g51126v3, partial [Brachypodium distachyon]